MDANTKCYLEILNQPVASYKFRCLSEENINDYYLNGENTSISQYPKVKLHNFDPKSLTSDCIVLIIVSLVTENELNSHPFILKSNSNNQLSLSKRNLLNDDFNNINKYQYYYQVHRQLFTAEIDNLNIITISKSKILKTLKKNHTENVEKQLEIYGDLNKCKLKFEAFAYKIRTKELIKNLTEAVYSNLIENSRFEIGKDINLKSNIPLEILCINKLYTKYKSDEEIFIITSFIEQDDIRIEFLKFDEKNDKNIIWLKIVEFNHTNVFQNCSIAFVPPVYDFEQDLSKLNVFTKVFFRLYRPSTNQYSDIKEFYYLKDDSDILDNYSTEFLKKNKQIRNLHVFNNKNKMIQDDSKIDELEKDVNEYSFSEKENLNIKDQEFLKSNKNQVLENKMEIDSTTRTEIKTEINKIDMIEDKEEQEKEQEPSGFDEVDMKTSKNNQDKKSINKPVANKLVENKNIKIRDLRKLLDDYEKKMNNLADRTSNALINVAETRSLYKLIGTQRYLLSVQNDDGDTPLHIAIQNSNFDILELFVDVVSTIKSENNPPNAYFDIINIRNKKQLTPLLLAANQKENEVCEFLLESGAKLDFIDSNGSNCFHIACNNNDCKLLEVLIKYLKNKQPNYIESTINRINYDALTPLHVAVKKNSVKSVELLINSNYCKINETSSKDGMTALHYAASLGHVKITILLLRDKNIEINSKAFNGLTPLNLAIINKNYFVVKKLMSNDANLFIETENCLNKDCNIDTCKQGKFNKTAVNINQIRNIKKDFNILIEYSKSNFNSVHYANNDEIMYYLLKKENIIQREFINKILISEIRKTILKADKQQLELIDAELKDKISKDDNYDVLPYFEKIIKQKYMNKNLKFTGHDAKQQQEQEDQLDNIHENLTSLNITEKEIPTVIIDESINVNNMDM